MNSTSPQPRRTIALVTLLVLVCAIIGLRWKRNSPPATLAESAPASPATTVQTPASARVLTTDSRETNAEPWHGPKKREGIDAANIYAEAFVLFDRLTEEEKTMLRKPGEEVDAEKAAQLFEKIQAIMALLHAAAKTDYCDWGTGEISFDTGLPHVGKAQDLAKLALWAAAYRFPSDPAGAIDDLSARARLGHNIADTLIGILVAASFEGTANGLLRDRMSSLDATATSKALDFIGSSTLDADISRAIEGEMSGVESFGKKLMGMSAVEKVKMLLSFNGAGETSPELLSGAKRLVDAIRDAQHVQAEVAFARSINEKVADAMRLPDADFKSWWKGVEDEMKNDHPLARLTVPALGSVQSRMQQLRVERTLLTAGADVLQNGPSKLGRYRDPATGGALLYVQTPNGFDLRSTYQVKGKPVSLSFPQTR